MGTCKTSFATSILMIQLLIFGLAKAQSSDIRQDTFRTPVFPRLERPSYQHLLSAPGMISDLHRDLKESDALDELNQLISYIANFQRSFHGSLGGNNAHLKGYSNVTTVLQALYNLRTVSSRCVNDTGHLLINMAQRQLWALKFIDAAGKVEPGLSEYRVNFVGDYDLCRSLEAPPDNYTRGYKGNYCTLQASLGPPNPIPLASLVIQWGVCMPSTCNEADSTLFLSEVIELAGLNNTLFPLQAEDHNETRDMNAATKVAIVVVVLLGVLMILGTSYDIIYMQWPVWTTQWASERPVAATTHSNGAASNGDAGIGEDEALLGKTAVINIETSPAPQGKLVQALLAFSAYTNAKKVLNTSQSQASISCLHGIRFFSMTWVILGHVFAFGAPQMANLGSELPKLERHWTFDGVGNAFVSVDTFFVLSGFLTAYVTLSEMRRKGKLVNWGLFYFHRFWRLTPPYMLSIVLVLGFTKYFGSGPLWPKVVPDDTDVCEKHWWTNLLYIQNLVHKKYECFSHAWYLANDMQFFWVSPLMLIPLFFNKMIGLAVCFIFLLVSMITTGALSTHNNWPARFIDITSPGWPSYFLDYYIAPWCRIGPFVLGLVLGYFFAYRPKYSIKLPKPIVLLGWLIAAAVALAVLYGLRGDISKEHITSNSVNAFYNAVARSAWAASICWVIFSCHHGYGGFVNVFLSWSPFVVLGRLTYMAYLIHPTIIHIYFYNQPALFFITPVNYAVTFLGILVVSYCVSFVLMLALESPMIGLEKILLSKRRRD